MLLHDPVVSASYICEFDMRPACDTQKNFKLFSQKNFEPLKVNPSFPTKRQHSIFMILKSWQVRIFFPHLSLSLSHFHQRHNVLLTLRLTLLLLMDTAVPTIIAWSVELIESEVITCFFLA